MKLNMIIISGPTASGKTNLALKLAREFNGEIISADSRQVYKEMDIVTGKDLPEKNKFIKKSSNKNWEVGFYDFAGIKVWGLDFVSPDKDFSVAYFVKIARQLIEDIKKEGKLPIITGGTAFWIKSLINPPESLFIKPNQKLREELEKLSIANLQDKLKSLDQEKWQTMNNSDRNNSRRIIRAIEVAKQLKKSGTEICKLRKIENKDYLWLGIVLDNNSLEFKIKDRVKDRIQKGALEETKKLLEKYDLNLPSMSAIGYKDLVSFIEGKINFEETVLNWTKNEINYAKRQMTFLNKEKEIEWFDLHNNDSYDKIKQKVNKFLKFN